MDLLDRFQTHLTHLALPPGRALVAVSGGPDSVVLLDLLHRTSASHRLELIVAHVDHGIHPASSVVAGRVERLARELGLPVEIGRLNLGPDAGETRAREQRYAWLEGARRRHGAAVILTAHHADDQAETVLMRVLAGSGPAGLAGITEVSGHLVRPLLPFRRGVLTRYVRERGLAVWIDPANQDPRHLRSWLRCDVLPILRARLPEVDATLLRVGLQAAGDRAAWDAVLDLLPGLDPRVEDGGISVAAPLVAGYDSALGQGVLLALARRAGCPMGPARAGRVLGLVARGASGTSIPLASGWRAELA
ncbi:MAG: tRNA lysidine(34) synthetase TilS, partial [Gemmatimonadales bacterium]